MYIKNEELVHMHQHRIMKNKKFFEDNSFEGSQFFKWTEEFNEMLEALDDLKKNGMGQNYLCHAAEEIADEVITRIQWDMSEELKENAKEQGLDVSPLITVAKAVVSNTVDQLISKSETTLEIIEQYRS